LATRGEVRLLASIGDFGLFSQALVHVACAVISKSDAHQAEFTALVTDNAAGATGDALRELRKTGGRPPALPAGDNQWKLFSAATDLLAGDRPWRILTPEQRSRLDALEAAQTPTVESLFEISQGVQTGALSVFLLTEDEFRHVPAKEKRFFRRALMTDSIRDGRIVKEYHLFFPHAKSGPLFADEASLKAAAPYFYAHAIKPNEATLKDRASILRSNREDWWGLMHPRGFSFNHRPRIISKFFGTEGSFVLDLDAKYLPSTGHVWSPRRLDPYYDTDDADLAELDSESADVMRAYVALLNSSVFTRLVSYRSVTLSGGQFDLSSRFVGKVMIPNLWEKAGDSLFGSAVRRLSAMAISAEANGVMNLSEIDHLVANLYGIPQLAEG